jgi:hypothetical protein
MGHDGVCPYLADQGCQVIHAALTGPVSAAHGRLGWADRSSS